MPKKVRITTQDVAKANDRLKVQVSKHPEIASKSVHNAMAGIDDTEISSAWQKAARRHDEAV